MGPDVGSRASGNPLAYVNFPFLRCPANYPRPLIRVNQCLSVAKLPFSHRWTRINGDKKNASSPKKELYSLYFQQYTQTHSSFPNCRLLLSNQKKVLQALLTFGASSQAS